MDPTLHTSKIARAPTINFRFGRSTFNSLLKYCSVQRRVEFELAFVMEEYARQESITSKSPIQKLSCAYDGERYVAHREERRPNEAR